MEPIKNNPTAAPGETNAENIKSNKQGRLPEQTGQTPAQQNADISQVDQQEGQMNNGELGGNFDAPDISITKQP